LNSSGLTIGVFTDTQCVIRSTTLYTVSHNFLHNLQILQTNPGAHLTSCSMAPRAPPAKVKRSGFEADHSNLSSVKVENECSRYTSSVVLYLHYAIQFNSMHRDNFSFISCLNYKDCSIQEIIACFCETFSCTVREEYRLCCPKPGN
jgi:hypothetical protein